MNVSHSILFDYIYWTKTKDEEFLANVNSCSRSLYVVVRLSSVFCLSSVTFVHPTQKFSAMFLRHVIRW